MSSVAGMATRMVVLLRAVNVGGRNKVPMKELRDLLADLGGTDVATYLQSGNAVVTATGKPAALGAKVAAGLQQRLGLSLAVLVRTADDLEAVVEANPLPVGDPKMFHVGFLAGPPDQGKVDAIDHDALRPERVALGHGVVYLGYVDSTQSTPLSRLRLGVEMTARSWRTVLALQELARS